MEDLHQQQIDPAAGAKGAGSAAAEDTAAPQQTATPSRAELFHKNERTAGLKLFDVFLYPGLTNIGVFLISVAATYLTTRGGDRKADGTLVYGKIGEFFHKRGEWLVNKFQSAGLTKNQADMGKMVFFSFLDGSIMAPFVKLLEDRREKIARWIDDKLGTTPKDLSIYAAEPKQTWLSVLGGRFATAAIVVPTAVALDKTGLNDTLFNNPGQRAGEWLEKTWVASWFGKLDIKEITRTSFFEAFYTSVCTAGLYFSSRLIASMTGKKKKEQPKTEHAQPSPAKTTQATGEASPETTPAKADESLKRPRNAYAPAPSHEALLEAQAAMATPAYAGI